jgi:DNA gyrase/topoisomerase IV subunit B
LDVTITNLSKFVTGSFDLPKEIARSTSADIVNHCDCKWDEIDGFMKLLTARSQREPSVFSNLKARLDSMGVSLNGITYVGSTASSEVLRKHKEEADKADTAENEDRELAKERQREKERQKTELDRIDLEGKVADTKIRQDRQRIEAEQELKRVRVDFEAEMKEKVRAQRTSYYSRISIQEESHSAPPPTPFNGRNELWRNMH